MHPFKFFRPADQAVAANIPEREASTSQFIAGGTTLVDLLKLNVMRPERLVDINRLSMGSITPVGDGVMIGALVKNSDLASHPLILERYPLLSQALLSGASAQLRNMATVGGNIMQRSRCPYFRDTSMPCNKREPGTGCPAIPGYSRMHAIFGVSDHCISAHPSDMCVALVALEAIVHTEGERGKRRIPIDEFYLVPEDHPERENILYPGELIVSVELPPSKFSAHHHYLKIRDRASFTFALVSVAVCLDIQGGTVRDARIVLGGVGAKPWRVQASEKIVIGSALSSDKILAAAGESVKGAKPQKYNKFKVELTRRSVARALELAAGVS